MKYEKTALLRLPFDQYQRYRTVSEIIDRLKVENHLPVQPKILDVGGYPGIIREFLPEEEVTVLDIAPLEAPWYVQGSGTELPFSDGSFDVVVSLDTFEHVRNDERKRFVKEMHRVSKCLLVICAPFDNPTVGLVENLLYEFIKLSLHAEHIQLKEHIENELPNLQETLAFLASMGSPPITIASGYVFNWIKMMLVKHYLLSIPDAVDFDAIVDEVYNRHFYFSDQKSPSYRQVIVAWKGTDSGALKALGNLFECLPQDEGPSRDEAIAELNLLGHLLSMTAGNRSDRRLVEKYTPQGVHVKNSEQLLDYYKNAVASFEEALRLKDNHITNIENALRFKDNHIANIENALDLKQKEFDQLQQEEEARRRALKDELTRIKQGKVLRLLNWIQRIPNG